MQTFAVTFAPNMLYNMFLKTGVRGGVWAVFLWYKYCCTHRNYNYFSKVILLPN